MLNLGEFKTLFIYMMSFFSYWLMASVWAINNIYIEYTKVFTIANHKLVLVTNSWRICIFSFHSTKCKYITKNLVASAYVSVSA